MGADVVGMAVAAVLVVGDHDLGSAGADEVRQGAGAVVGIGGGERSGAGRGACHPGVLPAARPAQELGRADPEVAAGPGEFAGAEPAELLGRRDGAGCGPASVPGHGRGIDVGID